MSSTRLLASMSALAVVASLSACGGPQEPAPPTTNEGDTVASNGAEPVATGEPAPSGDERRCGSRGLAPCADTEYCDFPDGSQCGATDGGGVCRDRPHMCTREYAPVCGCDGQTHATLCVAASQGVDVSSDGACAGDPAQAPLG